MMRAFSPWLDRTTPVPRAWPPPAQPDIADTLRDIRTRDRYGHVLHVAAALLFAFFAPLDQGPNSVASIVLVSITLVRVLTFPALFTPLLRWTPLWIALAWVGWTALSATWSPRSDALRLLNGQRLLLGVLALWPVLDHTRALAWALVLAAATNAAVQVAQKFGVLLPAHGASWRPSGLVALPAVAAINGGSAILLSMALLMGTRGIERVALYAVIMLCGVGITLAASRFPALAFIPALILLSFMLVRLGYATRRSMMRTVLVLAVLATIALVAVGEDFLRYLRLAAADAQAGSRGDVGFSSIHLRVFWWKASFAEFLQHPVIGGGVGSFTGFVDGYAGTRPFLERSGISLAEALPLHPHSSYLRALAETGIIGFTLFCSMIIAVLLGAFRNAVRNPNRSCAVVVGACASLVFILLCTSSECVELMNVAYAHLVVVIAICALPRTDHAPPL